MTKDRTLQMTTETLNLVSYVSTVQGRQADSYSWGKHAGQMTASWDVDEEEEGAVCITFDGDATPQVWIGMGPDEQTYPIAGYCAVNNIPFEMQ